MLLLYPFQRPKEEIRRLNCSDVMDYKFYHYRGIVGAGSKIDNRNGIGIDIGLRILIGIEVKIMDRI